MRATEIKINAVVPKLAWMWNHFERLKNIDACVLT